jgi:TolB-like protein
VQIAALRRVLDDGRPERRCIQTVPGRGYRFTGPVTRVDAQVGANAASVTMKGVPPLPDKPSVAVLPFDNMSGDPEQDYFADGVVEDIITALSRIRWLFVIARNSSFTYKGQAIDVKQVGRELGVRYVLEGAMRKAGGRVRITAQLIDATTGAHLSSSRPWKRPRSAARPADRQTTSPPWTSTYARSRTWTHLRRTASFGRCTCSGKR